MALMGAEVLFYPTAIGTEPYDADLDTSRMWRRAMIGHAVSQLHAGGRRQPHRHERGWPRQASTATASSADEWGDLLSRVRRGGNRRAGGHARSRGRAAKHRAGMGFFRDRRPQLYGRIARDSRSMRGASIVPDRARLEPAARHVRPPARRAGARRSRRTAGEGGAAQSARAAASAPPRSARRCGRYANAAALVEDHARAAKTCWRCSSASSATSAAGAAGSAGPRGCSTSTSCCGAAGLCASPGLDDPASALPRARLRAAARRSRCAPDWRDPFTGLTVRQLKARLTRPPPASLGERARAAGRALSSVGRATDF